MEGMEAIWHTLRLTDPCVLAAAGAMVLLLAAALWMSWGLADG